MSTATQERRLVGSALPQGGGYRAEQAADGTWTIYDVPVFAAHKREGMPRVTRVWLERAVAKAQADKASGYLAPLHVGHHNTGQPVSAAGKFLLTRVADFAFAGGAPRPTAFADFVGVSQGTYDEIKAGKLPYRSIEAADLRVAEINSIALLDHDAPYFKFPLLSIGSEAAQPAQAQAGARFTFNAQEGTMIRYSAGAKPTTGKQTAKAKFAAGVAEAMEKAKAASAEALATFTETLTGLTEGLATMAADLGVGADAGAEPDGDEPAEDEPMPEEAAADAGAEDEEKDEDMKPAEAPAAKSQAAPLAASAGALPAGLPLEVRAQFAAMQGRLKVLEGEHAKSTKANAKAAAVAKATSELAGYAGDFAKDLGEAFDIGGAPAVALYARTVKAMGVSAPPESFTGDLPAPNEPAEVTAYAMAGTKKHREARHLHAVYTVSPAFVKARPLAEYLALQMGAPPKPKA